MIRRSGKKTDYFCDRCKKLFVTQKKGEPQDQTDTSVKNGICAIAPVVVDGQVSFLKKHLCGDCTTKLSDWFRKGRDLKV